MPANNHSPRPHSFVCFCRRFAEFHIPTGAPVSVAQHPRESQFEFVLQFRRSEEYDCHFCRNAVGATGHIHIEPIGSGVVLCAGGQRVPLSNGVAAHLHSDSAAENEGNSVRTNAILDRRTRSSTGNGKCPAHMVRAFEIGNHIGDVCR